MWCWAALRLGSSLHHHGKVSRPGSFSCLPAGGPNCLVRPPDAVAEPVWVGAWQDHGQDHVFSCFEPCFLWLVLFPPCSLLTSVFWNIYNNHRGGQCWSEEFTFFFFNRHFSIFTSLSFTFAESDIGTKWYLFCTYCKVAGARSFHNPYDRHCYLHFASQESKNQRGQVTGFRSQGLRTETVCLPKSTVLFFFTAQDGLSQFYFLSYG